MASGRKYVAADGSLGDEGEVEVAAILDREFPGFQVVRHPNGRYGVDFSVLDLFGPGEHYYVGCHRRGPSCWAKGMVPFPYETLHLPARYIGEATRYGKNYEIVVLSHDLMGYCYVPGILLLYCQHVWTMTRRGDDEFVDIPSDHPGLWWRLGGTVKAKTIFGGFVR